MALDDKVRAYLRELGAALNEAVSSSEKVHEILAKVKSEGYGAISCLDATVALDKRGRRSSAALPSIRRGALQRTRRRRTASGHASTRRSSRSTSRTSSFLRSVGIDPTRPIRARRRPHATVTIRSTVAKRSCEKLEDGPAGPPRPLLLSTSRARCATSRRSRIAPPRSRSGSTRAVPRPSRRCRTSRRRCARPSPGDFIDRPSEGRRANAGAGRDGEVPVRARGRGAHRSRLHRRVEEDAVVDGPRHARSRRASRSASPRRRAARSTARSA